jgi:hypothetical protein
VLVRLFVTVANTCKKQLKGERIYCWLMVSDIPVHGQLALLFFGHGEAHHGGGACGRGCSPYGSQKAERREGAGDKGYLSRACPH